MIHLFTPSTIGYEGREWDIFHFYHSDIWVQKQHLKFLESQPYFRTLILNLWASSLIHSLQGSIKLSHFFISSFLYLSHWFMFTYILLRNKISLQSRTVLNFWIERPPWIHAALLILFIMVYKKLQWITCLRSWGLPLYTLILFVKT